MLLGPNIREKWSTPFACSQSSPRPHPRTSSTTRRQSINNSPPSANAWWLLSTRARRMNAVEFLKMLRPDGPWVITTIVPDGPTCTRSFAPGEEASAEKFIATENSEGKNIYYTVNLTGYMNSKPKKNDITHAEYQHIDADPGPEETPEAFKARVLPLFETF